MQISDDILRLHSTSSSKEAIVGVSWKLKNTDQIISTSKSRVVLQNALGGKREKLAEWGVRPGKGKGLTHPAFYLPHTRRYQCVQDGTSILSWASTDEDLSNMVKMKVDDEIVLLAPTKLESDNVVAVQKNGCLMILTADLRILAKETSKSNVEITWAKVLDGKLLTLETNTEKNWHLCIQNLTINSDQSAATVSTICFQEITTPALLSDQVSAVPLYGDFYKGPRRSWGVVVWQGENGVVVGQGYKLIKTRDEVMLNLVVDQCWLLQGSQKDLLAKTPKKKKGKDKKMNHTEMASSVKQAFASFHPLNTEKNGMCSLSPYLIMVASSEKQVAASVWDSRFGALTGTSTLTVSQKDGNSSDFKFDPISVVPSPDGAYLAIHSQHQVVLAPMTTPNQLGSLACALGKQSYLRQGKEQDFVPSLPVHLSTKEVGKVLKKDSLNVEATTWEEGVTKPALQKEKELFGDLQKNLEKGEKEAIQQIMWQCGLGRQQDGDRKKKDTKDQNSAHYFGYSQKVVNQIVKIALAMDNPLISKELLQGAIQSGKVSARLHRDLVPKLLEMEAGKLLLEVVRFVPDLPESDIVQIIRHLLLELKPEVADAYCQPMDGKNGKKRKLSDAAKQKKKKKKANTTHVEANQLSPVALALTNLMMEALGRSHNPAFLRSSLASQLGSHRLEAQCLLTALNQIIKSSRKRGLSHSSKEIKGALDWVGAVIDANFTQLVFNAKSDSSIAKLLKNINTMIEDQLAISESLMNVIGLLEMMKAPNPTKLSNKETPDYSIEVLRF